jgi:hypothetical protein
MINQKTGYRTPGAWMPTVEELARKKATDSVFSSEHFKEKCAAAEIEPTRRQAVKFKNKRGLAFKQA